MLYRRLDENWDYCFGRGRQNYISGLDAVVQAIKTRLQLLKEEWWEDQNDGLPLWQEILGSSGSEDHRAAVDIIIRDRISGTAGVLAVTEFESQYQNRQYIFEATVESIYGSFYLSNKEG